MGIPATDALITTERIPLVEYVGDGECLAPDRLREPWILDALQALCECEKRHVDRFA
jgi:hypothetical protein